MSRYIDADALRAYWLENGENEYVYDTNAFLDSIDNEPTADVAPVVNGHWEHIAYDKYRCSVCKRETTVDTWLGEPLYKGCPYCFAIMDEKDGETDGKKL